MPEWRGRSMWLQAEQWIDVDDLTTDIQDPSGSPR